MYMWINIFVCSVLFIFFAQQELKSLISNGFDYFSDIWNAIDAINLSSVFVFLICISIIVYKDDDVISICMTRTIGGYAVFFMWIKVFYWMRLFPSLAYYVNLIK